MHPQLAEEFELIKVFMNADNHGAVKTLVIALNHWERMVFEIFVAHFQQRQRKDVPHTSTHCRALLHAHLMCVPMSHELKE